MTTLLYCLTHFRRSLLASALSFSFGERAFIGNGACKSARVNLILNVKQTNKNFHHSSSNALRSDSGCGNERGRVIRLDQAHMVAVGLQPRPPAQPTPRYWNEHSPMLEATCRPGRTGGKLGELGPERGFWHRRGGAAHKAL